MFRIGVVLLIAGTVTSGSGALGISALAPSVVMGGVMMVIGVTIALIGRGIGRSFEQQALLASELATRGVRRHGVVKDVVPYGAVDGGAVLHPEGAQLVLRIELAPDGGRGRTVTCHLIEDTEQGRARIGQDIVVIEHPEEPSIRAIEGYLPNGRRRSS